MVNILGKFRELRNDMSTYKFGLLQTKAYRILKNTTAQLLEKYNLTTVEWAFLGVLYDDQNGIKISDMAEILDVEIPFVTATTDNLEKNGFITRKQAGDDKRSKILMLTLSAKKQVPEIERYLRHETKFLLEGISINEILAYRKVMLSVINNARNKI
jgi:MarR family transcriptional regulator for hemolysin